MVYRIHSIRTPRLLLRTYNIADAPLLQYTIQENLTHLKPWMPWACNEPETVKQKEERIEKWATSFQDQSDVSYGIFLPNAPHLLGGCGFHYRSEPKRYDIGYWLAKSATGKGYIREASYALAKLVLLHLKQKHVDICCKQENIRSAAVPQALGFHLLPSTFQTDDSTILQVWRMNKNGLKHQAHFEPISYFNETDEEVVITDNID